MNRSLQIPNLPFLRSRHPSLAEFESLLDYIPQASLLLDLEKQSIVLANAMATELTAFTRSELIEFDPNELLPFLSNHIQDVYTSSKTESYIDTIATRQGQVAGVDAVGSQLLMTLIFEATAETDGNVISFGTAATRLVFACPEPTSQCNDIAGNLSWSGGVITASTVIALQIEITPGGFPNSINPRSRGVIPIAILGSETFDVADVDVTTLAFGPSEARTAGRRRLPWRSGAAIGPDRCPARRRPHARPTPRPPRPSNAAATSAVHSSSQYGHGSSKWSTPWSSSSRPTSMALAGV